MRHGTTGGKRDREAKRDRRKLEKADRLRRNREDSARQQPSGEDGSLIDSTGVAPLGPVDLADVVIGVAARPEREPLAAAKLYVGGLSWDTTADELQIAFSNFGKVVDAKVVLDRATGRSRGFGFVTFESHAAADEAITQMNGRELDGRPLRVNRAEPT
jgi:RNA recognition motif-containing protein